jgi:hypothetical protein
MCSLSGPADNAELTLCDLHAREFHRRIEDMRGPDDEAVWNAALDAAETQLVPAGSTSGNPIDAWIQRTIAKLRK